MIYFLDGHIVEKSPTRLIVDVQGVGYEINITLPCFESLGNIGEKIKVITYLHVREDIFQLYGFQSKEERELFLQLISSPGIGPKKAQVILSSVSVADLQKFIIDENLTALTSLSGVGKKTAQRLILDLKDKVKTTKIVREIISDRHQSRSNEEVLVDDALLALGSLGFNKNSAQLAVQKVLNKNIDNISLEELIKQALRQL